MHTMEKLFKKLYSWLFDTWSISLGKTFTSSGNLAIMFFPNAISEKGKAL